MNCRMCVGSGMHRLGPYIGPNSQVPRARPSLLYDHTNVILRVVVKDGFYCIVLEAGFIFFCKPKVILLDVIFMM